MVRPSGLTAIPVRSECGSPPFTRRQVAPWSRERKSPPEVVTKRRRLLAGTKASACGDTPSSAGDTCFQVAPPSLLRKKPEAVAATTRSRSSGDAASPDTSPLLPSAGWVQVRPPSELWSTPFAVAPRRRSEEHTSELQSQSNLV